MTTELKRMVVYLTDTELEKLRKRADKEAQTVSGYVRTHLGLKEKFRGAPVGNQNAIVKQRTRRKRRR
ncbi:MAG TPA: hypothetical protein VI522_03115 [Gammaproteobacteria bacterium]|nr:hypothetical protein [Gammaproteobacteria bacterium]